MALLLSFDVVCIWLTNYKTSIQNYHSRDILVVLYRALLPSSSYQPTMVPILVENSQFSVYLFNTMPASQKSKFQILYTTREDCDICQLRTDFKLAI